MNVLDLLIEAYLLDKTESEREQIKLWVKNELPNLVDSLLTHLNNIENCRGAQK